LTSDGHNAIVKSDFHENNFVIVPIESYFLMEGKTIEMVVGMRGIKPSKSAKMRKHRVLTQMSTPCKCKCICWTHKTKWFCLVAVAVGAMDVNSSIYWVANKNIFQILWK
jgi:hypothetical protein